MGGRGQILIPKSGNRLFESIDVENTRLSKKQLEGLSLERYDEWLAARKDFKYTPEMKEPRMTQRQ